MSSEMSTVQAELFFGLQHEEIPFYVIRTILRSAIALVVCLIGRHIFTSMNGSPAQANGEKQEVSEESHHYSAFNSKKLLSGDGLSDDEDVISTNYGEDSDVESDMSPRRSAGEVISPNDLLKYRHAISKKAPRVWHSLRAEVQQIAPTPRDEQCWESLRGGAPQSPTRTFSESPVKTSHPWRSARRESPALLSPSADSNSTGGGFSSGPPGVFAVSSSGSAGGGLSSGPPGLFTASPFASVGLRPGGLRPQSK